MHDGGITSRTGVGAGADEAEGGDWTEVQGQANSAATNASGSNGMRSPTASPTPT